MGDIHEVLREEELATASADFCIYLVINKTSAVAVMELLHHF